jgi:hypothetical protein
LRFGSDRTALVLRQGSLVEHLAVYAKLDTMATVGHIVSAAATWEVDTITVDTVGLGAGIYDRLAEVRRDERLPWTLVAVDVSKAAPSPRKGEARPRLLRDWLWIEVARWLGEEHPVFAGRTAAERQACEDLAGELASVTYGLDSQGRLVVEDKDSMRKRLGHSPDLADALGCTFGARRPWAGQVVIL